MLYDLRYCSQEHLLSTDYVVVDTTDSGSLKPYAVDGGDGLDGLTALLRAAGYAQLPGYRKPPAALEKAVDFRVHSEMTNINVFNSYILEQFLAYFMTCGENIYMIY